MRIAALVVLVVSWPAVGEKEHEFAPEFIGIASADDSSALSMTCDGERPFTKVECHFTQVALRKKSDDEVAAEVQRARASASTVEAERSFKKMCLEIDGVFPKRVDKLKKDGIFKARIDATEAFGAKIGVICKCKTTECRDQSAIALIERQARQCRISTNTFDLTFKRAGENKWISNPGPRGVCNLVTIYVIERDPKNHNLFTYTQTRVTADTDSEFCKGLESSFNKPMRFSWDVPSEMAVECSEFTFGI